MSTKTDIDKNSKLKECLLKSFDNIMNQQNKMDNKAYIFLGFIIFIFNAFFRDASEPICFYSITLFIISLPLICSLLPIATAFGIKIIKLYKQEDNKNEHNIFYYTDICHLSNERFKQVLSTEYGINELTLSDSKLIEQIIVNAEILNAKVIGHAIFLWFILGGAIASIIYHLI